jgi:hypothetical protein
VLVLSAQAKKGICDEGIWIVNCMYHDLECIELEREPYNLFRRRSAPRWPEELSQSGYGLCRSSSWTLALSSCACSVNSPIRWTR